MVQLSARAGTTTPSSFNQTSELKMLQATFEAVLVSPVAGSIVFGFVCKATLKQVWETGWGDIFENTEWPELRAYLQDKNLIQGDE